MADAHEDEVEDEEVAAEEVVEEEPVDIDDITVSDVCTKYRDAAKIVDLAIQGLTLQAVAGARVLDLCKFGDSVILAKCASIYAKKVKGKLLEKGVAFPTSVSVNECVCHNSPLESDANVDPPLAEGDVVKLDVGCYVDGYIAVAAHTLIVGAAFSPEAPLTGPRADAFVAAHICGEVATKLLRPGNTNSQITAAVAQVTKALGVSAVAGVLCHRMKRFVVDGNKVILLRDDVEHKVETQTFEAGEVYSVDIAMSTGDGKPRPSAQRTTVYKRAVDKNYRLKMRASRYLFNEVNSKFPALPFALRACGDERQARMGVVELLKHELLHEYPVLFEKTGAHVVHLKFTVLLLPGGPTRICGPALYTPGSVVSDKALLLPDEINAILSVASTKKKKKRAPKKKGAADGDEEA
mmetsp:Transcript_29132/g.98235  ORF Transcript_29132/g.98235 Transcript_29132/m.98235 type:complete len:409 (-) Transcript_29132:95-1321(-)